MKGRRRTPSQESFVFTFSQDVSPSSKDGHAIPNSCDTAKTELKQIALDDVYREKAKKERARNLASALNALGHLVTR